MSIVALLMNFSLFITKAVVDASNILALHFYNLIVTPNPSSSSTGTQAALSAVTPNSSFSGAFMQGLKIQTLYSPQTDAGQTLAGSTGGAAASAVSGQAINFGKIILIGAFGSILMLTAMYVFLVAAMLFIVRVVVLMMVMILSPIAFLSYILPSTEHYAEVWKEALIKQAFFAPVYMALCYVVVKTIQSDAFKQGVMSVNSSDALGSLITSGSTGGLAFAFNFIILIALMLASILVAKKMEAYGHETAIELGKQARGFVGRNLVRGTYINAAAGVVGYGAQIAGGAMNRLGLKKYGDGLKNFGKKTNAGAENLRQKAFDVTELHRNLQATTFGKSELGNLILEKTTGQLTEAKFGGEKSAEEAREEAEALKSGAFDVDKQNEAEKASDEMKKLEDEIEKLKEELKKQKEAGGEKEETKAELGKQNQAYLNALQRLEKAMTRMSTKGFLEMPKRLYLDPKIMQHISGEKIAALMKDEHVLDNEEKEHAMGARWAGPEKIFNKFLEDTEAWKEKKKAHYQEHKDYYATPVNERGAVFGDDEVARIDAQRKALNKEAPALDSATRRMIRNMRDISEFEMMNTYHPEIFKNKKFMGTILQGSVDGIRNSKGFTSQEKEDLREGKSHEVWDAAKAQLGIDVEAEAKAIEDGKLTVAEAKKQREDLDEEMKKDPEAFLEKLQADDAANKDGRNNRYALHLMGKDDIEPALKGKTQEEISKMPGRIWEMAPVLNNMDAGRCWIFKGKDEGDKVPVVEHMLAQWLKKDSSGNRAISKENLTALHWFVNYKEGQTFTNFQGLRAKPELWKALEEVKAELAENNQASLKPEDTPENKTLIDEMHRRWAEEDAKKKAAAGAGGGRPGPGSATPPAGGGGPTTP